MTKIKIQSDANTSTLWVKDFMELANAWESFAENNHLDISGLITPYGIRCKLTGSTPIIKDLEITVLKKLEDISPNVLAQMNQYSSIFTLSGTVPSAPTTNKVIIRRNNWIWNSLRPFMGLNLIGKSPHLFLLSNRPKSDFHIDTNDLEKMVQLYWLKLKHQNISLKCIDIPRIELAITNWFNAMERVITQHIN